MLGERDSNEEFWRQAGSRLAQKLNLAHWLESLLPAGALVSLFFACVLLIVRRQRAAESTVWWVCVLVFILVTLLTYLWARRRFFSKKEALVRLDVVMRMNNRLTSAADGVASWPNPQDIQDHTCWRWSAVVWPIVVSTFVLSGAVWVPINLERSEIPRAPEEPLVWKQIESWLDSIEEQELVDPEVVQQLNEHLEDLKKQPANQWYNHSNLEASDNVRKQLEHSMENLARNLKEAESHLSGKNGKGDRQDSEKYEKEIDRLLEDLKRAPLPLDEKTHQRLEKALKNEGAQSTQEELEHLKETLNDARKELENALKKGEQQESSAGRSAKDDREAQCEAGDSQCENQREGESRGETREGDSEQTTGEGKRTPSKSPGDKRGPNESQSSAGEQGDSLTPGDTLGRKGIGRGPGQAGVEQRDQGALGFSGKRERITGMGNKEGPLSDFTSITKGQHDPDLRKSEHLQEGGQLSPQGVDGKTVWKNSYTPKEREILKRVFE